VDTCWSEDVASEQVLAGVNLAAAQKYRKLVVWRDEVVITTTISNPSLTRPRSSIRHDSADAPAQPARIPKRLVRECVRIGYETGGSPDLPPFTECKNVAEKGEGLKCTVEHADMKNPEKVKCASNIEPRV